jgi:uncharacterized C2H2 Zn-finger protein
LETANGTGSPANPKQLEQRKQESSGSSNSSTSPKSPNKQDQEGNCNGVTSNKVRIVSPEQLQRTGSDTSTRNPISVSPQRREKLHQCVICGEKIRGTSETVAIHLAKHRLEVGDRLAFRCPRCNVAVMKLKKLLEHIDEAHPSSRANTADTGKSDKTSVTGVAELSTTEATKRVKLKPFETDASGMVKAVPDSKINYDELQSDNMPMDLSRTSYSKCSSDLRITDNGNEPMSTAQHGAVCSSSGSTGNVMSPVQSCQESTDTVCKSSSPPVGAAEQPEPAPLSTGTGTHLPHPSEATGTGTGIRTNNLILATPVPVLVTGMINKFVSDVSGTGAGYRYDK